MSLSHTFPSGQGTHAAHVLYQLAQQPPRRLSFIVALCQDENTSDRVQCNIQSFTCHFNQYRLQYSLNTHQVMLTFLEMARSTCTCSGQSLTGLNFGHCDVPLCNQQKQSLPHHEGKISGELFVTGLHSYTGTSAAFSTALRTSGGKEVQQKRHTLH